MTRKQLLLSRLVLIMNGSLFTLTGIDFIDSEKLVFGLIQLAAALLNLFALLRLKQKSRFLLGNFVLGMNVIVTLSTAVDYYLSDRQYIQYAWLFASILSLIALIISIRKSKVVY